jgi:hypothetical protein
VPFWLPSSRHAYRANDVESSERTVNGEIRQFANTMTGIVENGHLLRVWGTQRDISERKRADAIRAYLAAIVASSDDAISVSWAEASAPSGYGGPLSIEGVESAESSGAGGGEAGSCGSPSRPHRCDRAKANG